MMVGKPSMRAQRGRRISPCTPLDGRAMWSSIVRGSTWVIVSFGRSYEKPKQVTSENARITQISITEIDYPLEVDEGIENEQAL